MILLDEFFYNDLKAKISEINEIITMFPLLGETDRFVMVMPVQGQRTRYYTNSTINLSIVVQDTLNRSALENAMRIYDLYRDQFNRKIELPIEYKAAENPRSIIAKYIQPVDHPVPLGDQGNGRYQYSINFIVHLKEYE